MESINNMLKLNVTSDLHGILPDYVEEFDLMLICGDICPARNHFVSYQEEWLENEFVEWVNKLPFKETWSKVVITPGNHDFVLERKKQEYYDKLNLMTNGRLIILRNKEYVFEYINRVSGEIEKLKIFGTPYCQHFGRWAFMRDNDVLKKKFDEMPKYVDILISHSSPDIGGYGYVDFGTPYQRNAGCPILAQAIKEKQPRFAFYGHIHSGDHTLREIDGTMMANVSLCDEAYDDSNNILKMFI